ncbi:hypothetical protein GCM10027452_35830 [Micromonospora halotolerans]
MHRQLTLLDAMERREHDAEELEDLFRVDHLATRMRRNAENLIVLSGSTPGRAWRRNVPMVDVVRGAVAEVEDYTRVTVRPLGPVSLTGRAVGDVIHLLAELIENGLSFSPPHTTVEVRGMMVSNGFAIEIEDRGLGMGAEELAAANRRIVDRSELNLANAARLGLFVVSRLTERHGVKVQLKESAYGGTTAVVLIPLELVTNDGPDPSTSGGFPVGAGQPAPAAPAPPVPAGADLSVSRLAPFVTPNREFYRIDTALVVPQVDPATWRLRIHGRVRKPIELSFDELLARPMVERYVTLACVSNEVGGDLIGNARWLGVPIRELLDEVEPEEGADQVVGRSVDGWTCGTPTAVLRDGRDALLAVGMNGEPLPVEHGFPVRMVVPGLYGYVSACKWVTELELTSFADFDAYWVPRGWSAQGPIRTQSRIDTPRPRNRLTAGPVTVAGVAWAQHRGIRTVEVRVDGGPWQEATLAPTVSVDTWVQWSWRWDATPGDHTLQVRATDSTGETQPEQRRPVAPDGATGWHTVKVTVG